MAGEGSQDREVRQIQCPSQLGMVLSSGVPCVFSRLSWTSYRVPPHPRAGTVSHCPPPECPPCTTLVLSTTGLMSLHHRYSVHQGQYGPSLPRKIFGRRKRPSGVRPQFESSSGQSLSSVQSSSSSVQSPPPGSVAETTAATGAGVGVSSGLRTDGTSGPSGFLSVLLGGSWVVRSWVWWSSEEGPRNPERYSMWVSLRGSRVPS